MKNILISLGLLLSFLTVLSIYRNWKNKKNHWFRKALPICIGFSSIISWSFAVGIEYGIVFSLLPTLFITWLFIIVINKDFFDNDIKTRHKLFSPIQIKPKTLWLSHILKLFTSIIMCCLASILLSLTVVTLPFFSEATRLVLSAFFFCSIWTGFVIWSVSDEKVWRPFIGMLSLSSTSLLTLWALY